MQKPIIVIPTYKRWDSIINDTYNLIKDLNFDIYIFVEDEENYNNYKFLLDYKNIKNIIITNTKGITEKRNFILNYFNITDKLLFLDDDIKSFYKKIDKNLVELNNEEILNLIEDGFNYLEKKNLKLFGIYPIANHFFMSNKINNNAFIIGQFMGIIKTDLIFDIKADTKEDYDFTIQNIKKYGGIVRYDYITMKAKGEKDKNKGGCNDYRNLELKKQISKYLLSKWPNHLIENSKREGEILIKIKKETFNKKDIKNNELKYDYLSPRISGEYLDCSMPMTFDQYSNCAFKCVYCFSQFQKTTSCSSSKSNKRREEYLSNKVRAINFDIFKNMFLGNYKRKTQKEVFKNIIDNKMVMQWGGLADPFCPFEEKYGLGYKILEFLNEIEYPVRFSSKTDIFLRNEKYFNKITEKPYLWYYMESIITNDEEASSIIEKGTPSPKRRFENLKKLSDAGIYTALRLRPFIIGLSDKTLDELFENAALSGAKAVSTEFFCLEMRSIPQVKEKYKIISDVIGFDIMKYYQYCSNTSGYLRLNYKIKEKYINKMLKLSKKYNLKFYCSDAHHKDKCNGASCCGLPDDNSILGNYQKCQFTNALLIAKKNGEVKFLDILKEDKILYDINYISADNEGLNTLNFSNKGKNYYNSLLQKMRNIWNTPNSGNSPYKYFGGILVPVGLDENEDIIYKYDENNVK